MSEMRKEEKCPENNKDCRAISSEFFNQFKDGNLKPFVDLVKEYPEQLTLCFRANSDPEQVTIYYNNHAVFTITNQIKSVNMSVNPNIFRYHPNAKEKLGELVKKGFSNVNFDMLSIKDKNKNGSCSVQFKNSIFKQIDKQVSFEWLDSLYDNQLRVAFETYFDKEHSIDQFKKWVNTNHPKYKGKIKQNTKKQKLEKIRQQQLFAIMKQFENGYLVYDLEFALKHDELSQKKMDMSTGVSNMPDMLAIRFGSDCKPEALVFVEVKSTKSACTGKSGVKKHIESMGIFPLDRLPSRCDEAFQIIEYYYELGLVSLPEKPKREDYVLLAKQKKLENIIIFTDEAVDWWKSPRRKKVFSEEPIGIEYEILKMNKIKNWLVDISNIKDTQSK